MRRTLITVATLLTLTFTVQAQSFSSGSTGADGALDTSLLNCPGNSCEVQLPESGIFNYTTVNIPGGTTLRFKRNHRNTPVIILAQGNVNIVGTISVSATNIPDLNYPGPGGFFGGGANQPGFGPGGGTLVCNNRNGKWVGPLSLVPLVGGSGAAGMTCFVFDYPLGGGGGGAIAIASSTSIVLSTGANITASGGGIYAGGAGGAIRLVANSLTIAGNLTANGGNPGVIRLEAPDSSLVFTGSANPAAVLSPINPVIVSNTPPSLTIVSIGGYSVPSYSGSRFDTVDLLLPNQLTDPINIVVRGNNIPLGTQVEVRAVNGSGSATYTPGTLSGTLESSTATATASGLNRTGVTYLLATATFDPPQGAAVFNPKGPDQVAKVRVEAAPGAKPKYVFLRGNGTVIDVAKLPQTFLQQFGQ
jgi:hypothetical protein